MIQASLFGAIPPREFPGWAPPEFPDLSDEKELISDTETNGLRWYAGDKAVGYALGTRKGKRWYFPVGHAGGNLPRDKVVSYLKHTLRGKKVHFYNAKFDGQIYLNDGIDLEALDVRVVDLAHGAALLNDHRFDSKLETVAQEYLGVGKIGEHIDKSRMAEYHAAEVYDYACHDVHLTDGLIDAFAKPIADEGLQQVWDLESECIYATMEMERNGCDIDEEKLDLWLKQSAADYVACLWGIREALGFHINPNSTKDLQLVYDRLGLAYPRNRMPGPDYGKVTFAKQYMAESAHPTIQLITRARRLHSLRAKYLIPYRVNLTKFGKIIYALHQLRADDEGGEAGTISGRYSSSAFNKDEVEGINIQQVAGKKFQHTVGKDENWPYKVRELFVPKEKGHLFIAGDADQVEYRWFAHYAQPPAVMAAYAKDPKTNFHKATQAMIEEFIEITYERTKDTNFAGLFGAGLSKFVFMIGLDKKEIQKVVEGRVDNATPEGKKIYRAYHSALPEAREIYKRAMAAAEERGWVKTFLGRRARFPYKGYCSPAFSRVIQGSAADENKTKLVALRKAKTGMRLCFTVHDEAGGSVPDLEAARKVSEVLNSQILQTRVPLLWTVNVGPNWQDCKKAA